MKRSLYTALCLICAAAGIGAGRLLRTAPVTKAPPPDKSSSVATPSRPAVPSAEKTLAAERSGPRRASLMLAMSSRGERKNLSALIASCMDDPSALAMLAGFWLETDPAAFTSALSTALNAQNSYNPGALEVLHHLLVRWCKKDHAAAWNAASATTGRYRRFVRNNLVSEITKQDPKTGLDLLFQHPELAPAGFIEWNPEAMREFFPLIAQLPDSLGKRTLLSSAAKGLPLAQAMAALNPGEYSSRLSQHEILREAATRSLDEVTSWHETSTGSARYAAARVIGDRLALTNPAAAVDWARDHLSGEARVRVLKDAVQKLSTTDPAAAEAARALLPETYRHHPPQ